MKNLSIQPNNLPKKQLTVTKVFYDGWCPLCKREIQIYQRQPDAKKIKWINVNSDMFPDLAHEVTQKEAMDRFHVSLSNGKVISGAHGFICLWLTLENFHILGRILNNRISVFILITI